MTTRFLTAADLHLGSGHGYVPDRLADHRATLTQIVDLARERDVDAILIAGDVFDRPRPNPSVLHTFRDFTRLLEHAGIPAIAITGNLSHDLENGDRPSALELFQSDWLRVVRRPELVKGPGDVAVCCLPSVPVHRLVAARDGGDRSRVFEDAASMLVEIAARLRGDAPEGWPSVLLTHFAISGATLPTGLPTDTLGEPVVPLGDLQQLGFDAIVAGHIHQWQTLGEPGFFYTGSPLCLNFGEAHIEHGVVILDVGEACEPPEFVPLDGRRFVTVDVDLTQDSPDGRADSDWERDAAAQRGSGDQAPGVGARTPEPPLLDETDRIAAMIAEQLPLEGTVIRIRYTATEEQHRRVDRKALTGFCEDAGAHVYQVAPNITRAARARAEHVDETLDPAEAVTAWCTANDLTDALVEALARLTAELLAEVPA